ncbi:hypothetical protein B0H21DRAFT_300308 [Amylocystis lapponica]|nr:hypothetical protein B0H21DRAFT_300308 [Amylocystis lapponica]
MPSPLDNFVVDLHDLSAIILSCHEKTEPTFANAQLVEVNNGTTPIITLPQNVLHPDYWTVPDRGQKAVAYILRIAPDAPPRVAFEDFASPDGVQTPSSAPLNRRELENVYWRCKTYDSGYLLTYVAQTVLERLPRTATLQARTSRGHILHCSPEDVTIGEFEIRPIEACYMVVYKPLPHLGPTKVDMSQHMSGFDDTVPWVYLMIGKPVSPDLEVDTRVVLDLALPQIGGRGGGGELFALEKGFDYHNRVLSQYAYETDDFKYSEKLRLSPPGLQQRGNDIAAIVLERLEKIARGKENFCRYCGKGDVDTRCSKCKKACFCKDCHTLGWKYHKAWCT